VQVKSGTTVVGAFSYDGLGRRTQKTVSGLTTRYLYDELNVVQEQDGTGAVSADLLAGLGLDETYRRSSAGASRDLLTDALGSVIGLINASGAIGTSYSYEAFGRTVAVGDADANPSGFTGRENEACISSGPAATAPPSSWWGWGSVWVAFSASLASYGSGTADAAT
jgi:YD repeat-containing protein